jgi:ubiquitin carboxyl-terminal hydrolase 10
VDSFPSASLRSAPDPGSPKRSNATVPNMVKPKTASASSDYVDASIGIQSTLEAENSGQLPEVATVPTKKAAPVVPLTKSFASLLRGSPSSDKASSRTPDLTSSNAVKESHNLASGHDSLITQDVQLRAAILPSTQVGFSLPAMGSEDRNIVLSPHQHANLLQLIKTSTSLTPGTANSASADGPGKRPMIIPRGLVNTGNICFANAILQALVYTPPFWKLFTELDKFAPFNNHITPKGREVATPIVNAM